MRPSRRRTSSSGCGRRRSSAHEDCEEGGAGEEERDRRRGVPAPGERLHQGDEKADQARGEDGEAGGIEALRRGGGAVVDPGRAEQDEAERDHHLQSEHRSPADRLGCDAGEQRPYHQHRGPNRRVAAERVAAVFLRNAIGDQRRGGGIERRGAHPGDGDREHEPDEALRDGGGERAGGEDAEGDQQDAPVPVEVAETAAGGGEQGECEEEGVDHPLALGGRQSEVGDHARLDYPEGDLAEVAGEEGAAGEPEGPGREPEGRGVSHRGRRSGRLSAHRRSRA